MLQHTFPIFYGNRIALAENTTFHFYGSDSKEKFFTNRARLGESWKYYDSLVQLTYKSDNYGFRNHHSLDVIQHAPYIVTMGCSHTMGTGIHHEDTYSCHLENLAGIPVYNMGLGGSSNEVSFLNLVWLLTNFNPPKTIVFQQTGMSRFPLISQNETVSFEGPWSAKDNNELRDFMILSDAFGYNNTKFLLLEIMLQQLTTKYGVNLYAIPDQISVLRANTSCSEPARDLVHGGKDFNEFLAKYIWSSISNK